MFVWGSQERTVRTNPRWSNLLRPHGQVGCSRNIVVIRDWLFPFDGSFGPLPSKDGYKEENDTQDNNCDDVFTKLRYISGAFFGF